jgi:hypothetical protein
MDCTAIDGFIYKFISLVLQRFFNDVFEDPYLVFSLDVSLCCYCFSLMLLLVDSVSI